MKNIAIIPARSGSKGLPDKNIRPLKGVPLMAYTIKAALDSGMFDRVMVSTDSEEYAEIAKQWGAEVPFLRSAQTSADTSSSWSVVKEVLEQYARRGETFDTLALLQATSPLRRDVHIREAYEMMEKKSADSVVSVNQMSTPIEKCRHMEDELRLGVFAEKPNEYRRRQNFSASYEENGAIYLWRTDKFSLDSTIFTDNGFGYEMDKLHSVDVDDLEDFTMVEAIVNYLPEFKDYFRK